METDNSLKRIAINGRFLTQPVTGVQRYAYELVRAWDQMLAIGEIDAHQYKFELVAPHFNMPEIQFNCIPVRQVGRLRGNLWEQIELPWFTRGEFLFNPCNTGPLIKMNQVVTIHDASVFAVPESYSWAFRAKYGVTISVLAKTAKVIFTVSNFSRDELVRYCHIPVEKLVVVYEGCDHMSHIQADYSIFERNHIGDKPYILTVSSNAIHKNFSVLDHLAELLADRGMEIIIAGGKFKAGSNATPMKTIKIARRLGYVTDMELKALYERASIFVYPSNYEGFGLPPLEAMACGCPAIVSNVTSLPEICGNAALYIEPDRPDETINKILEVFQNPNVREKLKRNCMRHASNYKWSSTAKETWRLLQTANIF